MREVIIGRSKKDVEKHGKKGTLFLGKQYITMGQNVALSNPIRMDVTTSHSMFICGKRGGGKSYTMGVIAEGFAKLEPKIFNNLSIILLDTMGVYWTMKYPNKQDALLLEEWGLEPGSIDVKIYTPEKYYKKYKEEGIPTDEPFSLRAGDLDPDDWIKTFDLDKFGPKGILIQNVILNLKDKKRDDFTIRDVLKEIERLDEKKEIKKSVKSMFKTAKSWGVFSSKATPLNDLAAGGQVTVLDLSCYATMPGGWEIKSMVLGIVAKKLFTQRMDVRKSEEFDSVKGALHYFTEDGLKERDMPLVWLVIDEAHEFMPHEDVGETPASEPLMVILREGRQPGISLILATQQPGKIHSDVMTQSDIVLSHRVTARLDVEALSMLRQSYMQEGIVQKMDHLPRVKGSAVLFDDSNERLYPMKVRPRFTWHGGSAPSAIPEENKN